MRITAEPEDSPIVDGIEDDDLDGLSPRLVLSKLIQFDVIYLSNSHGLSSESKSASDKFIVFR